MTRGETGPAAAFVAFGSKSGSAGGFSERERRREAAYASSEPARARTPVTFDCRAAAPSQTVRDSAGIPSTAPRASKAGDQNDVELPQLHPPKSMPRT